ncbi:MAG: exopolysaccharide biosynthesis protein [Chthoniobacter sp.]
MAWKFLQGALLETEAQPRRLSTDLRELLEETAGRVVTLGELEQILKGRGFALFLLLMSLPFAFPVAIPGLSIPFGIVIMLLGLRITFGMKPSLPGFILRREVPRAMLEKIAGYGLKLATKMEKLVKPRMHFLQRWPGMINLIGLGIASGGFLLSLPLPPLIPFSNTIPAVSVLLLTAGLIERDGLLVFFGYLVNITAWIYFVLMFTLAGNGVAHLWAKFGW